MAEPKKQGDEQVEERADVAEKLRVSAGRLEGAANVLALSADFHRGNLIELLREAASDLLTTGGSVEAVARRLQILYAIADEEPVPPWARLPEVEREEWRGDARSVLKATDPNETCPAERPGAKRGTGDSPKSSNDSSPQSPPQSQGLREAVEEFAAWCQDRSRIDNEGPADVARHEAFMEAAEFARIRFAAVSTDSLLSREEMQALLDCWGYDPSQVDASESALGKLRAALSHPDPLSRGEANLPPGKTRAGVIDRLRKSARTHEALSGRGEFVFMLEEAADWIDAALASSQTQEHPNQGLQVTGEGAKRLREIAATFERRVGEGGWIGEAKRESDEATAFLRDLADRSPQPLTGDEEVVVSLSKDQAEALLDPSGSYRESMALREADDKLRAALATQVEGSGS